MRRFFVPSEQIGQNQAQITGQDARHIRRVLRLGAGDRVILFDGRGGEYQARIKAVEGDSVLVDELDPLVNMAESSLSLTLGQAYLKEKKMDQLARQLTELGVRHWVPFMAQRSIPDPDERRRSSRIERWQTITREAVKQCRRSRPMGIETILSFQEALNLAEPYGVKLIFHEKEVRPIPADLERRDVEKGIFAMIGPEGGFDPAEIDAARQLGFQSAGLGPRVLRAETATLTVCALLQYVFGDLR